MGSKRRNDDYKYYQQITINGIVDVTDSDEPENSIKEKELYKYDGAVKRFDKIVIHRFVACTYAASEKKAIQNIIFQAKKKLGLEPSVGGFKLVGKVNKS